MIGKNRSSKNPEVPAEVAIIAGAFAILLYNFDRAALHCGLLDVAAWVARELLHSLILLAWHSSLSYLVDSSKVVGYLAHALTTLSPFLTAFLR